MSATAVKNIRLCDFVVQFLVDHGVSDVFLLTGNGAMYLNDAIVSEPRINYYCARNEAAAPMMAEGFARLTQKLGVVCVTAGPGVTNAVAGLAEAWVDSAPILVLSGQSPADQIPKEDALGIRSHGTAGINTVPIVAPMTKYAVTVTDPKTIRYHLEKAVYLAKSGRPGPVWIDIPMDVQYATIDPEAIEGFSPPSKEDSGFSDVDRAAEAILGLLEKAKRPLILCGHGIRQGDAIASFETLVERLGAPIVSSRLGQDIFPLSHPLNMGHVGMRGVKHSPQVMGEADVVLSIGSRLAVQCAGHALDAFAADAKVVMVDIDQAELNHHQPRLDMPVRAYARPLIDKLIDGLKGRTFPDWSDWVDRCWSLKSSMPMILPEQTGDPIDLYHFMARLDAASDSHHVFITDAGSNFYVGGQVFRFEKGQREITSAAYAAMGLTIPLAVGAAVGDPKAQILAVTGDGSLELNIQELKTLSYYEFNIKLFVINNGGYVSMRNWQDSFFNGRRIGSDSETGAEMLNLEKVAEAFGIAYARIERSEEIDANLQQILADDRAVFVEVVTRTDQTIVQPFKAVTDAKTES